MSASLASFFQVSVTRFPGMSVSGGAEGKSSGDGFWIPDGAEYTPGLPLSRDSIFPRRLHRSQPAFNGEAESSQKRSAGVASEAEGVWLLMPRGWVSG